MKTLTIVKGGTFEDFLQWKTSTLVFKPITAISKSGGSPVITATGHGAPDGWPAAVVSVKGMTEINAKNWPPKQKDFHVATKLDANSVELNEMNAGDYKAYVSGGFLVYYEPHDMTGYTARMTIKDREGGTVLETLTVANGKIVINTTNYTITRKLAADVTAAYTFKRGVYDLEMVSPDGTPVVTKIEKGKVVVESEVTT